MRNHLADILTLFAAQFKHFIDSSIFRLRFLGTLAGCRDSPLSPYISRYTKDREDEAAPYSERFFCKYSAPMTPTAARELLPYIHSYLMYQVLRERPTATSSLGRIRLAAQALDGPDGGLECLSSLVCLAIAEDIHPLIWDSTAKSEHLDNDASTDADVFVAAAYLGRKDYVAHQIAKGIPSCEDPYLDPSYRSVVFGSAMNAATIQANLEIIKLLLLRTPQYCNTGTLPHKVLHRMLEKNNAHNHRENTPDREAVFDFVLDTIQTDPPTPSHERAQRLPLETALAASSSLENFERVAALLPPLEDRHHNLQDLLVWNVAGGNVEMVRCLLNMGVVPKIDLRNLTPIIRAVKDHNYTIVKMLLDFDMDTDSDWRGYSGAFDVLHRNGPSIYPRTDPLTIAVSCGRLATARLLLDGGMNPNLSYLPPIIMAVIKEHLGMFQLLRDYGASLGKRDSGMNIGRLAMMHACLHRLSSMQDILAHEGIRRDVFPDPDSYYI